MILAAITPELFYNVNIDLLTHFGQNCLVFLFTLLGAIPLGLHPNLGLDHPGYPADAAAVCGHVRARAGV